MASIYSCPIKGEDGESKRRYAVREWAEKALDNVWSQKLQGIAVSDKLPCRAYYCKECDGYHLTSQPYPYSTGEFSPLELQERL